jgi:serine phosphatase RsbU (regulator of sigma subunit)
MDNRAFLALILASAYRMLTPPELGCPREPVTAMSEPLHCPNGYQVWTFCLPCEQVGGDWLGVDHSSGEDLWTLVIDVTAHGYASYITAQGVSHLWQARPIVELRASGRTPQEVLSAMSQELEPVLPDEVFVEAALGRFTSAGEVSVAGAGFCRVVVRRAGQKCVYLQRIGGHLLGCFWGNDHEQEGWSLLADDELTIASDGLYEQPDEAGHKLEDSIIEHIARRLAVGGITHNAVLETLRDVVGDRTRQDDITVLSVIRRGEVQA